MKKNNVAHFEIYANDPKKLGHFYTTLFDWQIEPVPNMDYAMIKTVESDAHGRASQPGGINGGIMKRPAGFNPGAWVNYVNVDSVDQAVTKATHLGAHVSKPKSAVPGMGWFAMMTDPDGNEFAVWQVDHNAK